MRDWVRFKALKSVRSLSEVIGEMTEQEVLEALEIEIRSSRRKALMDRLIDKAAGLNRQNYINSLKEKCYGASQIRSSQQG